MCFTAVCRYEGFMGCCLLNFKQKSVIIPKDAACYDFTIPPLWKHEKEIPNNPQNPTGERRMR